MNRKRIAIFITALIIGVVSLVIHLNASAGVAEVYIVGGETVVLGGEGSSMVGEYPNPVPAGPGVREIVLGYTCIGTETLFGEIFPSFARYWEEITGEKVRFITGWNGIGIDGVASYVYGKPVQATILTANTNALSRRYSETKWQKTGNKGIVYSYPYVFLVRKGNPKNIHSYADLTRPDVEVVHVDPLGSHGGSSNIFSLYGTVLRESEQKTGKKDYAAAAEFLRQVEEKAILRFGSKTARMDFTKGLGDVLMIMEPRARAAAAKNDSVEIVYPSNTFMTSLKVYKMKKNIAKKDEELIDAFIDFLFTEESQEAFAKAGYRPSDPNVMANHPEFPPLPGVFGMDYLGEPTRMIKQLVLEKWIKIKNDKKPDDEKIKVYKSPDNKVPAASNLLIQQALPEE